MIIGIDASNIKAGGAFTHLSEIISNYSLDQNNKLVLFASRKVLEDIKDRPYLTKIGHSWLNKGTFFNMLWRLFKLGPAAKQYGIKIFFTPGGNFLFFRPYVSMSQNMLVFESKERNRFPKFKDRLRYIILEFKQVLSFRYATGIIYISEYAKTFIENKYKFLRRKAAVVIYHGVADRFTVNDRQSSLQHIDNEKIFKLLYISIINYYKHQDKLIEAIIRLKKSGVSLELHLIGPMNPNMKKEFEELLDKSGNSVIYHGKISYDQIHNYYSDCDLFVFASTCENMPNILVEAMKANVPILCSNYGPMPEILKDGGIYFDPINLEDICNKIMLYRNSLTLRTEFSNKASLLAMNYSWPKCADYTFNFISDRVSGHHY